MASQSPTVARCELATVDEIAPMHVSAIMLRTVKLRELLHHLENSEVETSSDLAETEANAHLVSGLSSSLVKITQRRRADGQRTVNRAPDGERMHRRNAFREKNLDFYLVAGRQQNLKPFVERCGVSQSQVNFKSWEASKALNCALLGDAYGLVTWDLPRNQLCPPVSNRSNYIHWVEDLLELSRPDGVDKTGASVRGLDVGVGANCVFPLLGALINGWSFVGIDIVDTALKWATKNQRNNPKVASLIEIRDASIGQKSSREDDQEFSTLLGIKAEEQFSFCMCNPPFFDSMKAALLNPCTNFGGTPDEMCYPGGEEAFTRRLLDESLVIKDRVHWYTTMCGKKQTLIKILHLLDVAKVSTVRTTRFLQGRTTRWGVAWSFSPHPISQSPHIRSEDIHGTTSTPQVMPTWRTTFELHAEKKGLRPAELIAELHTALAKTCSAVQKDSESLDAGKIRCTILDAKQVSNGGDGFWVTVLHPAPGSTVVSAACDDKSKTKSYVQERFALALELVRACLLHKARFS